MKLRFPPSSVRARPGKSLALLASMAALLLWIVTSLSLRNTVDGTAAVYDPSAAPWGLFSRFAILALVLALGVLLLQYLLRLSRTRPGQVLLLLLLITAAVRFIGIDHEIEERYYRDEGTYYHHASEINQGEMLRMRFVYPHLTYYIYAFSLFAGALFPGLRDALAAGLYGVTEPLAVDWLIMRAVVALLATAATVPVYHLAREMFQRLVLATGSSRAQSATDSLLSNGTMLSNSTLLSNGTFAGLLAGLALLSSTLWNEIQHLMISDGPAAVFAVFCVWFAHRAWALESDAPTDPDPAFSRRLRVQYLLAGVFAALAAAAKYPAGIVALAIITCWLEHRRPRPDLRRKANFSWNLILAGAVSLLTFVAVMPSLLVYTRQALTGGQGIFFGVRQYGGGGWIGVMPSSNTLYYLRLSLTDLGPALCITAVLGLLATIWWRLGPASNRSGDGHLASSASRASSFLSALLHPATSFGLGYFALIAAMNMVVKRNLLPVVPIFCVLTAVTTSALAVLLLRRFSTGHPARNYPAQNLLLTTGALLLVAQPLYQMSLQTVSLARPGTRVEARQWIRANIPQGSFLVLESYTPRLPTTEYPVRQTRFAPKAGLAALEADWVDYILVSSSAYARFFDDEALTKPHHRQYRETYEALFERHEMVRAFEPSATRQGPRLELYRGGPLDPEFKTETRLLGRDAFVPDGDMLSDDAVRYLRDGQWSSLGVHLAAGQYQLAVDGVVAGDATLEIITPQNRTLATLALEQNQCRFELFENLKVLLRLKLPVDSHFEALEIRPLPEATTELDSR